MQGPNPDVLLKLVLKIHKSGIIHVAHVMSKSTKLENFTSELYTLVEYPFVIYLQRVTFENETLNNLQAHLFLDTYYKETLCFYENGNYIVEAGPWNDAFEEFTRILTMKQMYQDLTDAFAALLKITEISPDVVKDDKIKKARELFYVEEAGDSPTL